MSRLVIGSRAELVAALRKQRATPERAERVRALLQDMFLDALFLVAQFPGGQIAEAEKCCYALDVCARCSRRAQMLTRRRMRAARPFASLLPMAATPTPCARCLLRGANVNAATNYGATALYAAAQEGHTDAVRALLAAGGNIDAMCHEDGTTPLYMAAQHGHADAVRMLLAAGANANAACDDSMRPLHAASFDDHSAAATLLLDAGAAVNALSNDGRSPLAYAKTRAMRALLAARGGV
jgi:ankyrin repeat protein